MFSSTPPAVLTNSHFLSISNTGIVRVLGGNKDVTSCVLHVICLGKVKPLCVRAIESTRLATNNQESCHFQPYIARAYITTNTAQLSITLIDRSEIFIYSSKLRNPHQHIYSTCVYIFLRYLTTFARAPSTRVHLVGSRLSYSLDTRNPSARTISLSLLALRGSV